jgi:hypothetical protein
MEAWLTDRVLASWHQQLPDEFLLWKLLVLGHKGAWQAKSKSLRR